MLSTRPPQLLMFTLVTGLLVGLVGGCIKVPTPGVYKLDIQQGNVVTKDMLARLEPNMERRKVRFLLGTPLIIDTFNADRWDYIYSFQEGGGERTQQHIVLIFEDNLLKRIEGDADESAIDVSPESKPETVVSVPDQESEGIFGGIGGWFGTDETRVPRKKPPPDDGDSEEVEEGFFANIFSSDGEAVSNQPAETEESVTDDVQPIETQEEAEAEDSLATPEESLDGYDQNTTSVDEETGDKDGFFARLKKKFDGSTEEETEVQASDSAAEKDDEKGFFQRLSDQFGLDAPLESPETKD